MLSRDITGAAMIDPGSQEPVDPISFRNALGAFVTGVTIVTTCDTQGRRVGLTANSFNSVSLDPPMILWSLGLKSNSLDAFRSARWWAVHILSSDQEALSARFAKAGIDKFADLQVSEGPDQIPLIADCAARFICRTAFEYEGGDHAIFVGAVTAFERADRTPLAFHQGRYARVLTPAARASQNPAADDGAFGRYFLGHLFGRAHADLFSEVRKEYRRRGLRGAEYTILSLLGIRDNCTTETIIERAVVAGVDVPRSAILSLEEKTYIREVEGKWLLTPDGRQIVIELIAVAQAREARLEAALAPGEMDALRHLIQRVIDPSAA
jgi:3-hydroxy-9,10-secoandrosta-1,3,5(10)-triene-9,17-dione monooxygenase reductase component